MNGRSNSQTPYSTEQDHNLGKQDLYLGKLGEDAIRSATASIFKNDIYVHLHDFSKKKSVSLNLKEYNYLCSLQYYINKWSEGQNLIAAHSSNTAPYSGQFLTQGYQQQTHYTPPGYTEPISPPLPPQTIPPPPPPPLPPSPAYPQPYAFSQSLNQNTDNPLYNQFRTW